MNKLLVISVFAILTACASPPGSVQQTPQQIAQRACPPTQAALTSFRALNGLTPDTEKALSDIQPLVDAACKDIATVSFDNLGALSATALPAVIDIVKASTLSPDDQNTVIGYATAAQLVLDIALAVEPQAAAIPLVK